MQHFPKGVEAKPKQALWKAVVFIIKQM